MAPLKDFFTKVICKISKSKGQNYENMTNHRIAMFICTSFSCNRLPVIFKYFRTREGRAWLCGQEHLAAQKKNKFRCRQIADTPGINP
ncbi:hypothetical protein KA005_16155, partial [bacterium]|nr:hypothetical protein [bacterium]